MVEWILVTVKIEKLGIEKSVEYYAIGVVVFWLIIFNWILCNKNKSFDDTTQHSTGLWVIFPVKILLRNFTEI